MSPTQLPIHAYSPYLQTGIISPLIDPTAGVGSPPAPQPHTQTQHHQHHQQQHLAAKRNEVGIVDILF